MHRVRRCLTIAIGAIWIACLAFPSAAAEPVGHVVLQASWVDEPMPEPDRRRLRLIVRPLVSLTDWKLTVSAPLTFDVRGLAPIDEVDFVDVSVPSNERAIRAVMRPLGITETLTLEFDVLLPIEGSGTVSFVAESDTLLGAVGINVRAASSAPLRRLGAAEFPAHVLSVTEPN